MERLIEFDKQLLLAINHWTSPWADQLMMTMSKIPIWYPVYVLVAIAVFLPKTYSQRSFYCRECSGAKMWKVGLIAFVSVLLCYIFTDHLSHIVRNAVCRPRPGLDPEIGSMVRLIAGPGNPYGFFSGHAANTIGFAILTSLIVRRRAWAVVSMVWALLISYSRSYLGQHYPIDVLTGVVCGIIFSLAGYWLYKFLMRKLVAKHGLSDPHSKGR